MGQYIYGSRNQVHIIDLEQTAAMMQTALEKVAEISRNKGKVLFVGTKRAAQPIVQEQAIRCGMPYVNHRWLGGMLTNYKTVRQSIKRYRDLQKMRDDGLFEKMIKKEALQLQRELDKLALSFDGIKDMGGIPDALFILDVNFENIAIAEANKLRIPVIAVVDTNSNPSNVDYVIPGNDDSMSAIEYYFSTVADVILSERPTHSQSAEYVEMADSDEKSAGRRPRKKAESSEAAPKLAPTITAKKSPRKKVDDQNSAVGADDASADESASE
jgi:small subunit ribosomal protein S2